MQRFNLETIHFPVIDHCLAFLSVLPAHACSLKLNFLFKDKKSKKRVCNMYYLLSACICNKFKNTVYRIFTNQYRAW